MCKILDSLNDFKLKTLLRHQQPSRTHRVILAYFLQCKIQRDGILWHQGFPNWATDLLPIRYLPWENLMCPDVAVKSWLICFRSLPPPSLLSGRICVKPKSRGLLISEPHQFEQDTKRQNPRTPSHIWSLLLSSASVISFHPHSERQLHAELRFCFFSLLAWWTAKACSLVRGTHLYFPWEIAVEWGEAQTKQYASSLGVRFIFFK